MHKKKEKKKPNKSKGNNNLVTHDERSLSWYLKHKSKQQELGASQEGLDEFFAFFKN